MFKELQSWVKISSVRSGGQTGMDHAGLVAGLALGIPVHGHYPKGYRRRDSLGIDSNSTENEIRQEIIEEAAILNPDLISPMGAMLLGVIQNPLDSIG